MHSRVYETVRCPSVCPPVNPIRAGGGFAAVGPAGRDIDRLLPQRRAACECRQCHVVSARKSMDAVDLFQ